MHSTILWKTQCLASHTNLSHIVLPSDVVCCCMWQWVCISILIYLYSLSSLLFHVRFIQFVPTSSQSSEQAGDWPSLKLQTLSCSSISYCKVWKIPFRICSTKQFDLVHVSAASVIVLLSHQDLRPVHHPRPWPGWVSNKKYFSWT